MSVSDMNFELVLKRLLEEFGRRNIRYALTGGFALGALGAPRATQDLDFLVNRDDLEKLNDLLISLDYQRIYSSENVSQYQGKTDVLGFLDFIHAYRELALEMLARAVDQPIFAGSKTIRVLTAEDVIGLKVQAMANSPKRKAKEIADIQALAAANPKLDWSRVQKFFELFKLNEDFQALKRQSDV